MVQQSLVGLGDSHLRKRLSPKPTTSIHNSDHMLKLPATVPPHKQILLEQLIVDLRSIPGIAAVVLGGSYARGTQHATSDLDVGLYYVEASPFAIADIKRVA